jgi:hypothetical protein
MRARSLLHVRRRSKRFDSTRVIRWLLDEENPSVRYFALTDLLHKTEQSRDVCDAKRALHQSTLVKRILSKQKRGGFWEDRDNPYNPKYRASYWTLMLLAQLGVDQTDPQVKKACEFIFRFQHRDGGFSSETEKTARRVFTWRRQRGKAVPPRAEWVRSYIREGQLTCLTGNVLTALMRMGYRPQDRVQKALAWLARVQNADGGWLCPYWRAHVNDTHGCFYGTICPLEAFSMVRLRDRTKAMKQAIERGLEFLLMHRLYKADHHKFRVIKKSWCAFGFPYFYGYDILRGLDVVTRLGCVDDARLSDAVNVLVSKRKNGGTWVLDKSPTGRMYVNLEPKSKPSKWITLIALRTLARLKCASTAQ